MLVKIYTDGAAEEIRTDREDMERFSPIPIRKDRPIYGSFPRGMKRQLTTGWS